MTTTGMLVAIALGYLIGSIPFGLILTRFAGAGDIRRIGSGNIGATNVLRTGRKGLALATLLFDAAKGALPTLLATWHGGPMLGGLAGLAAIIGQCYPVWLRFKGGKGVATAAGALAVLNPWALLAAFLVFVLVVSATRFVSLGSILAAIAAPVLAFLQGDHQGALWFALYGAIVIFKHHQNIGRLVRGEENRLSFAKKA